VGAGLLAVGSFLPWVSVRTIFGTISANGIDGDGKITLAAGALAVLLIATCTGERNRAGLIVGALASAAGTAVAVYDLVNVSSKAADLNNEYAHASAGWGLYVCAIGGAAGFIGAMITQSDLRALTRYG
jgi:hypothetical protein